jgi:hypothetical protein
MITSYKDLNKKLKQDIVELKQQILRQKNLLESSGGGMGVGGGGIDPTYNGEVPSYLQNKGYISGLAGGNSDAVVANPSIIDKTAKTLAGVQLGAFTYDKTPQKPLAANNIGLGMGLGFDDNSFANTRNFVNKYSLTYRTDPYQQIDSQELGYLSWKAVNDAVAMRDSENLKNTLYKWGLYSATDNGSYPDLPQEDEYSVFDPATAFAKKLKKQEESAEDQAGMIKGRKVNKILKKSGFRK